MSKYNPIAEKKTEPLSPIYCLHELRFGEIQAREIHQKVQDAKGHSEITESYFNDGWLEENAEMECLICGRKWKGVEAQNIYGKLRNSLPLTPSELERGPKHAEAPCAKIPAKEWIKRHEQNRDELVTICGKCPLPCHNAVK